MDAFNSAMLANLCLQKMKQALILSLVVYVLRAFHAKATHTATNVHDIYFIP